MDLIDYDPAFCNAERGHACGRCVRCAGKQLIAELEEWRATSPDFFCWPAETCANCGTTMDDVSGTPTCPGCGMAGKHWCAGACLHDELEDELEDD